LEPSARAALLSAIARLDFAYLRAHPFTGPCPTTYDDTESVYRFRGFPRVLPSCTYDLRGVDAVRQTERLLATPRPGRPGSHAAVGALDRQSFHLHERR